MALSNTEISSKVALIVAFAGGCHIEGWPIGPNFSFRSIVLRELEAESGGIVRCGVRGPSALYSYVRSGGNADVLVLQLGNYEAPLSIEKHFRAWSGLGKAAKSHPEPEKFLSPAVDPYNIFSATLAWRLNLILKSLYAAVAESFGRPLFDKVEFRVKLSKLLKAVSAFPGLIILVSPTPCADRLTNTARFEAGEIVKKEAELLGIAFIDSMEILGFGKPSFKKRPDIFVDPIHLNARGHELLASAVSALIRDVKR